VYNAVYLHINPTLSKS